MQIPTRAPLTKNADKSEHIFIHDDMFDALTLVHEIAHCFHAREYDRRFKKHQYASRERWHGPQHKKWMNKIATFVKNIKNRQEEGNHGRLFVSTVGRPEGDV